MQPANLFLKSLPEDDLQALWPSLREVPLETRHVLIDVGTPLESVYFIESGLVSLLIVMADGSTIETGMVGCEGLIGVMAVLGATASSQQVLVQAPGKAFTTSATQCREMFHTRPVFSTALYRFAEAIYTLTAQTAACNRLHAIEQRLARWLLMASDRIQSNEMPMTHDFLANMLGVRRVGVTEIAGNLQKSGLIEYHRGHLRLLDRTGLEETACECYQLDHARLLNLMQNGVYRTDLGSTPPIG